MSGSQAANDAEAELLAINNQNTSGGAQFGIVTIASGDRVPTGTLGTFLMNLNLYNELVGEGQRESGKPADEFDAEKADLERKMRAALPIMKKVGMFDLFSVDEWKSSSNPGRQYVSEQAEKLGY